MLTFLLLACVTPPSGKEPDDSAPEDTGRGDTGAEDSGDGCIPATEVCNGLDDDCNGLVDDAAVDAVHGYADVDGDGFGDAAAPVRGCDVVILTATDCDDADPTVHPGATDWRYDGIDQDCDGVDHDCSDAGEVFVGDLYITDGPSDFCRRHGSVDGDLTLYRNGPYNFADFSCLCEVTGELRLEGGAQTTLHGLRNLASVGTLHVRNSSGLTSLDGLDALARADELYLERMNGLLDLGGAPRLRVLDTLRIEYVDALMSVGGLALDSVGTVKIAAAPALPDFTGFPPVTSLNGLDLNSDDALTSLRGLETVQTADSIRLVYLDGLTSLHGLEGLTDVRDISLSGLPALTGLAGLDALATTGQFGFYDLPALTTLEPFHPTSAVRFGLSDLPQITSLTALADLPAVQLLGVGNLDALTTLDGIPAVQSGGRVDIDENAVLVDVSALNHGRTTLPEIYLYNNPSLADLSFLTGVTTADELFIGGGAVTSLAPLASLQSSSIAIWEEGVTDLSSLSGLTDATDVSLVGLAAEDLQGFESLSAVDVLFVADCDFLTSVAALPPLALGWFEFVNDDALVDFSGADVTMDTPIGELLITDNDELAALDGLEGVHAMSRLVIERNPQLSDLAALAGLVSVIDQITIKDNQRLSQSEAEAFCTRFGLTGRDCVVEGNGG